MADTWKQTYAFGSVVNFRPSSDNDGDGWTNLEEYLNGTSPAVADDPMNSSASKSSICIISLAFIIVGLLASCREQAAPTKEVESKPKSTSHTASIAVKSMISERDMLGNPPLPISKSYIAKDLLPAAARAKFDFKFDDPRLGRWAAFDGYPSRAKGSSQIGFLTKKGFASVFENICATDTPKYLQPIIGYCKTTHFEPTFRGQGIEASCYFFCPSSDLDKLQAHIEKAWRSKFEIAEVKGKWSLTNKPYSKNFERQDGYGFEWTEECYIMSLEKVITGKEVGLREYSVIVNPKTGVVKLTHWEGDRD